MFTQSTTPNLQDASQSQNAFNKHDAPQGDDVTPVSSCSGANDQVSQGHMDTSWTGKRAAIYARFSPAMTRPQSVEAQLDVCRAYCKHQGLEINEGSLFIEITTSASRNNGSELQRLISLAEDVQRPFDVLVVYDVSRIGRNVAYLNRAVDSLRGAGVVIAFVAESLRSDAPNFDIHFRRYSTDWLSDYMKRRKKRAKEIAPSGS